MAAHEASNAKCNNGQRADNGPGPNPKTNTNRDGLERGNSLNIYEEHEVHAYRTHTHSHSHTYTHTHSQVDTAQGTSILSRCVGHNCAQILIWSCLRLNGRVWGRRRRRAGSLHRLTLPPAMPHTRRIAVKSKSKPKQQSSKVCSTWHIALGQARRRNT